FAAANPTPGKCNVSGHQQVCCTGLLNVSCLIQILGSPCGGRAFCCETGDSVGGLVNVNLLNCNQLG
ncbi:hypothetical protein BGZ95_006848, partial [Linnemannia exigua]